MRHANCLLFLVLFACGACSSPDKETPTAPSKNGDATADLDASVDLDSSADLSKDMPTDVGDSGASAANCQQLATTQGWSFCTGDARSCEVVFTDGTGCQSVCAQLGLKCVASFEDEPNMCAYQQDQPPLNCTNTGHQSDYCVCAIEGGVVADMTLDADMSADMSADMFADMDRDMPADMANPNRPKHEAILNELVGYGQGTTGGAGGPIVEVTTLADSGPGSLREAVATPGPAWIRFRVNGTIALQSHIQITSNKTIDGRGADITISNRGLMVQNNTSNVILMYLKLRDSSDDIIRFYNGGDRMWVHHCDLSNGADGAFDATEKVTGVTISYTHIFNHDKAMLVGAGSNDGDGQSMRWTGHHNWYENVVQRLPFIRMGRAHSFNNLIMWRSGTAMSVRVAPGQMLVENNIFMPQTNVGHKLVSTGDGSIVKLVGNLERPLNGDQIEYMEVSPERVFNPSDDYTYTAETANDALIAKIRQQAGWQMVPWPE